MGGAVSKEDFLAWFLSHELVEWDICYPLARQRKLEIINDALVCVACYMGWPLDKCEFTRLKGGGFHVVMGSRRLDCWRVSV